ncbi:MAG: co-chaperone GroES [Chitinophagales bacterium]|nr:co-chaperone GroES [Chitinophagales bacterium]
MNTTDQTEYTYSQKNGKYYETSKAPHGIPVTTQVSRMKYAIGACPDFGVFDDRVLIMPDPEGEEKVSQSGIITAINKKKEDEKTHWGVVLAVGTNLEGRVIEVNPGDYVAYSRFAGNELEIDGQVYKLVRGTDIFGIDRRPEPAIEIPEKDSDTAE